jgi:hypothetical protein
MEEHTGRLAADISPYFAVGSFFTSWSMNSIQNPWGSGTKKERVVGPRKTGASDLLSVYILAALIRGMFIVGDVLRVPDASR